MPEEKLSEIPWDQEDYLIRNKKSPILAIEISIPFRTPSINHLFWHRGNMKIMTKEARELRKKIEEIVYKDKNTYEENLFDKKLKVEVEIYEDWYTKKGEVKKKDISNREKFLVDSVFNSLGLDDKFIFEHIMKKIQSKEEFAVIRISEKWGQN